MTARQFDHLRHLRFRHFKGINAADANPMPVNMQHDLDCFLVRLAKKPLQYMDHEINGSVIVIEDEYPVQRRLFGLWPRPGDDSDSSSPISRIAIPSSRPARRSPSRTGVLEDYVTLAHVFFKPVPPRWHK
jgi:hypothetical protein